MPQETNLSVSPYFDDFDANKNFYKVLFKPGYPVQARELTTLQSILQNQTEQFGKNIFKNGSPVTGGQLSYDNPIYSIEIESSFNGSPISLYFDQLLNKRVRGSNSGVTAEIFYILKNTESERGNYTLYLQYLQSGGIDFTNKFFQDGETLILETPLTYGNFTIQIGQGVCNSIATNSTAKGSSVKVASGVYFVNGFFAQTKEQRILLDQYGNTPSYKIGFNIIESIITSDEDSSLFDNAQEFSNYAAPGADRFQLTLELTKKSLDDTDITNFVAILIVDNGVPTYLIKNQQYNLIRDELARRTFDESGNYYVKPFSLFVRDSLNDRTLNNGLYFEGQTTMNGNVPSEDKMVYEIGPGKAYVSGYDVETISSRLLDAPKTRTTAILSNQVIQYNAGSLVVLNNGYGSASIGLGTTDVVSLMSNRIGTSQHVATGTTIGVARVYDFVPESEYIDQTSRLDLRLFDIQTYTIIGLTTSITQSTPALIKGKRSNTTGYLRTNVSSERLLTLYQVSGTFLKNEAITINGIDNGRLINYVKDYSISDIKSIYSKVGVSTFNADLILSKRSYIAPQGTQFNISSDGLVSAGSSINYIKILSVGDIIAYDNPSVGNNIIYNQVTAISAGGTNFTVSGITTVSGVCDGKLASATVSNIIKLSSSVSSRNSSLLTKLTKNNISSVSIEESEIRQRRFIKGTADNVSLNSLTITLTDPDVKFDEFTPSRFLITYSDGIIEALRQDKYSLDSTGKILTFKGLSKATGTADVIVTAVNTKPNSKIKKLNKATTLVVSNSKFSESGIGVTTLNDGLSYSQIYGTRVQDNEICLNVPDVVRVVAVYEASGVSDPALPQLQLTNFTGPTNNNQDFIIGEQIVGQTSGAVGLVINRINTDKIEYIYLNTFEFIISEIIIGKDSKTQALITDKTMGDKNITQNFSLDNGHRDTFYDYSRIIRKSNVITPNKKIKIIFQNHTIDSSDTGEFITANSYPVDGFKYDVFSYENSRLTDYIDIRPRVAFYTSSSKSPFEFDSRNFANDGQYSKYILAPYENLQISYSYYLPRIDRVYLNPDGTFEISQGIPSENPLSPALKVNGFDIATIFIPPYVYNSKNINVDMSQHKRYRMSDISLLEDRIQRVEKFTTLSMLESKTENFTIKDASTGLDRFKCGFFVDNFSTNQYVDFQNISYRAAIDANSNTLKPLHYTTSLDLQLGSEIISGVGQTYSPNVDESYVTDLGSINVKKTGDLVTLNYTEVLYFEQILATESESVTPFLVKYWTGSIELHPTIDSWIDEKAVRTTSFNEVKLVSDPIPDKNITIINNVVVNKEVHTDSPINQGGTSSFDWTECKKLITKHKSSQGFSRLKDTITEYNESTSRFAGFSGIAKNSSATQFLHLEVFKNTRNSATDTLIKQLLPADVATQYITQLNTNDGKNRVIIDWTPPGTTASTTSTSSNVTTSTASSSQTTTIIIPPQVITTNKTSQSISHYTEQVRYLRSRNIEFDVKKLKAVTQFYSFFQGIDIKNYIIPKLVEIQMISGKFQIGETVESDPHFTSSKISFRVCTPNHQTGPFNKPIETFELVPYTQQPSPTNYSESSTFLNVDTRSLQLPSAVDFYGIISPNMKLIGKVSGAVAQIKNIRLVSDNSGRLIGSLFIPDPNVPGNPKWTNGENTFTVIDVPDLTQLINTNINVSQSAAETDFTSSAITNITTTNILTTRNVKIIPSYNINTIKVTNTTTNITNNVTTTTEGTNTGVGKVTIWETHDPLAQSFYVKEDTGIFLTSVEVFFETKDTTVPVTLQLRPMIAGVPSNVVIPFSEVTLIPKDIKLSTNSSVATTFTFPSPVYLSGPQVQTIRQAPLGSEQTSTFAIVLLSDSPNYRVYISTLGKNDLLTGVKIGEQPTLGSLFKSQNGSTWTPSQDQDLKYKINRSNFVTNTQSLLRFFNPKLGLGNKKITVTGANQILPLSKTIIVGLGSTGYNKSTTVPGITLVQNGATGTLSGISGSVSEVIVTNTGFGYTNGTFANVTLITETGYGQGATATVGISANKINSVAITAGGFGYQQGDSLLIPNIGQNVGYGGNVVVTSIGSSNSFIISNVQGSFNVGITTISYINSSGIINNIGVGVTISSITPDQYNDGLHMKIYHQNHGMHSFENYVKVSKMRPLNTEVNSVTINELTLSDTSITVTSGIGFTNFEGIAIDNSNPGYIIIGDEVIKYTVVSGNTFSSITRAIDGTQAQSYVAGVPVYKYEFNGVSLRRINKVHNFAQVYTPETPQLHPIELNSYFIKVDMNATDFNNVGIGSDRTNNLFFKETIQTGQSGTILTNNIQFESITPNIANIIPIKTDLTARIRTFTGTSIGGNEVSFKDDGFENISLSDTTYFANPKLICSDVNEQRFINESPGNKSFTMELLLSSVDSKVSPVIDLINVSAILSSNLINDPIGIQTASTYALDDNVRSLYEDKHSTIYISKPIRLQLPANAIKVLLTASRNNTNDVRVLYQLFRDDAPEAANNYELFPGYSNYQIDGIGIKRIIDSSMNDGSADSFVQESSDRSFKDYEYSVDDLPDFNAFAIKIIMAGNNQATPPVISQLRAIATVKPRI